VILFESTLTLLLVAIVLLQLARKLSVPYPTMLALAGVIVAALPWTPDFAIEPHVALALFISPALLDAGYDLPPRTLRRDWVPLLALAAAAVVVTTFAVAWLGVAWIGLQWPVAIALGAIVAPPDAAAASAMLSRLDLPRRTVAVLKGESLLNDAVALLLFGAAVGVVSPEVTLRQLVPQLALAAPGGVVVGVVIAKLYELGSKPLSGTLGGTLAEFVSTFGVWLLAERLHVSPVLAVVAYAMVLAKVVPDHQSARARVHSYAVWEAVVFTLNVLAFMLVGLQARATRLRGTELVEALTFAAAVLLVVIVVRVAWVMLYNRVRYIFRGKGPVSTAAQGLVVGWCGMRGLVTLAAALALPEAFPHRDLVLLSALGVVLGTLILQGLTLGPLVRLLKFGKDESFDEELSTTRVTLLDTALAELKGRPGEAARRLAETYRMERAVSAKGEHPREVSEIDGLRREIVAKKRERLAALRHAGTIEDDIFHALEQELDFAELASSPPTEGEILEE